MLLPRVAAGICPTWDPHLYGLMACLCIFSMDCSADLSTDFSTDLSTNLSADFSIDLYRLIHYPQQPEAEA